MYIFRSRFIIISCRTIKLWSALLVGSPIRRPMLIQHLYALKMDKISFLRETMDNTRLGKHLGSNERLWECLLCCGSLCVYDQGW
jgi:hypothetical protein